MAVVFYRLSIHWITFCWT